MKRTQHTAYTLSLLLLASATVQAGNVTLGQFAGFQLTSGDFNVFIGDNAGFATSTGDNNTFVGRSAGASNTTASDNTFVGQAAGANNTGISNTFIGKSAGQSNTTGTQNTYIGLSAGQNATGNSNAFLGFSAGLNSSGSFNTFMGMSAGQDNLAGGSNTFVGNGAGQSNTTGGLNTFMGSDAGGANLTGIRNTFLGTSAGSNNTTGLQNTYLGRLAGGNAVGNSNVFLGYQAGRNEFGSKKLYIATDATTTPLIYGEFDNAILGINGSLGVGTQLPTSTVHVQRADGSAKVFVENTAGAGTKVMFNLVNTGGVRFDMEDTSTGDNWVFQNQSGTFDVTLAGTGTREFRFYPNGNLEISGSYLQASSRSIKHGVEAVDQQSVLEKVVALPINLWSYNRETGVRHMGPMSEDFYASFGLGGTDKGITTVDAGGVALAAIQGLKREKDSEVVQLKAENIALKNELHQLRAVQDERRVEQDERMIQLEMAMAEVLRNQSSGVQVGSTN